MRFTLENERLRLGIDSLGAELKSTYGKALGVEYLWQADPAWWGRTSPVLFPIVGRLTGNRAFAEGELVDLPQHGIARDLEFACLQQSERTLSFELTSTDATRARYPYAFRLGIDYTLDEDTLTVAWRVDNPNERTLPFAIGAHPGFSTRLFADDRFEDYDVLFDHEAQYQVWELDGEGRIVPEPVPFGAPMDRFALDYRYFAIDALIFAHRQLSAVTLRSRKHGHGVHVDFPGFPEVALWTAASVAPRPPFLCIEPWYGHADTPGGPFELTRKPGIQLLAPGGRFETAYRIRFF